MTKSQRYKLLFSGLILILILIVFTVTIDIGFQVRENSLAKAKGGENIYGIGTFNIQVNSNHFVTTGTSSTENVTELVFNYNPAHMRLLGITVHSDSLSANQNIDNDRGRATVDVAYANGPEFPSDYLIADLEFSQLIATNTIVQISSASTWGYPDVYDYNDSVNTFYIDSNGNVSNNSGSSSSTPGGDVNLLAVPLYRFYNPNTAAHFYTANAATRDRILTEFRQFIYETIAYQVWVDDYGYGDIIPVYRFYNAGSGAHFYTASESQKNAVLANFPQFDYEGIAFYAKSNPGEGLLPVHRFYNSTTGAHFYTNNTSTRDRVISSFPSFTYEGIAYYVPS